MSSLAATSKRKEVVELNTNQLLIPDVLPFGDTLINNVYRLTHIAGRIVVLLYLMEDCVTYL